MTDSDLNAACGMQTDRQTDRQTWTFTIPRGEAYVPITPQSTRRVKPPWPINNNKSSKGDKVLQRG